MIRAARVNIYCGLYTPIATLLRARKDPIRIYKVRKDLLIDLDFESFSDRI